MYKHDLALNNLRGLMCVNHNQPSFKKKSKNLFAIGVLNLKLN